jgi:hypothetical protein
VTVEYHVNAEDELLSVKIDGPIDLVEMYELAQSILADPAFDPAWPQLVDARGMQLRLRDGAVKPFTDYVIGHYRSATDGAIAVVVSDDLDHQQVAGIFRLVCAMSNTEMFDDYGLAIKWLLAKSWNGNGVPPPSLQPPNPGGQ